MLLKKWLLSACVGIAICALSPCSFAHEESHKDEPCKDGEPCAEDEGVVSASVFLSGPDGTWQRLDSGDDTFAKLPEGIRVLIKKSKEAEDGNEDDLDVQSYGRVIIVDSDGNRTMKMFGNSPKESIEGIREEALRNLPEEVRKKVRAAMEIAEQDYFLYPDSSASGSIMAKVYVMGPDGKKREFQLGHEGIPKVQMLSGRALPFAVDEKKEGSVAGKKLSAKLDLILQRLEDLEARVNELSDEKQ